LKKIVLDIDYSHNQQLSSFYVGLELLRRKGFIDLSYSFSGSKSAFLFGSVGEKTFCIDCLDGNNWIVGDRQINLEYFRNELNTDFILKRSYSSELIPFKPNSKVFPFGFNYPMGLAYRSHFSHFGQFLTNPYWTLRYFRMLSGYFDYRTFEAEPALPNTPKILFQVRLWDPSDAKDPVNREHRVRINQFRIDCLYALKQNFPKLLIGGVSDSAIARKLCPELILPSEQVNRNAYFSLVRESAIGIATTGLHESIGWKMGEYIAASRAIVSEELNYQVPGEFESGKNYLCFLNTDQLLSHVDSLVSNPVEILKMMKENYMYYYHYLRPDQLVWNALKQIQ